MDRVANYTSPKEVSNPIREYLQINDMGYNRESQKVSNPIREYLQMKYLTITHFLRCVKFYSTVQNYCTEMTTVKL